MKGKTEKSTVLQDCAQKVTEHLYSEWEMQNFIQVPKKQISGFFFFYCKLKNALIFTIQNELCILFNVNLIYQEVFEMAYKTKPTQKYYRPKKVGE